MMQVLIAPDKFKGSLSALEVGEAIREGLLQADPEIQSIVVPLADGGEGTTEILTRASAGTFKTVSVRDPFGRPIIARYGLSRDGNTAFMEMAAASGLHLVSKEQRNPLYTSTIGTGDLIKDALDNGVRNICIGIGGTATNDGGMGAMIALGVQFLAADGSPLDGTGESLARIDSLDVAHLHPRMRDVSFTIFCDVDNPLYGPRGAAFVFAPQKGASPEIVRRLDNGLQHYESVLQLNGYTKTNFPGAGAGGGFPVGLCAFGKAVTRSGISFIMDYVKLEQQVKDSTVVITGEGKLDDQTLSGKVVSGVASLAARHRKKLIIVAGASALGPSELARLSVAEVITLVDDQTTVEMAISHAAEIIKNRVYDNSLRILGNR